MGGSVWLIRFRVRRRVRAVFRLVRRAFEYERAAKHGATKGVRIAHYHAFLRWLCLKLEQQSADLERMMALQTPYVRTAFLQWLRGAAPATLIPSCALPPEPDLFVADLQVVVELMGVDQPEA